MGAAGDVIDHAMHGLRPKRVPDTGKPWFVWELDAELRYLPVVDQLPAGDDPICEIGCGTAGLAAWTPRKILGIDPGPDDRHGGRPMPPNLERLVGDGLHIPLPDKSVAATVAVDTFEHIPPELRRAVVDEMIRVTMDGGRIIINGPSGSAAAEGDRQFLADIQNLNSDSPAAEWLHEHIDNGLPSAADLSAWFDNDRVASLTMNPLFDIRLWRIANRAYLGHYQLPRPLPRMHSLAWAPFASVARRYHKRECYRRLVVAEISR